MTVSTKNRHNGNGHQGRSRNDDADARYAAALSLVQAIDKDLQRGTRHYYNSAGKLLVSLDEVIEAILRDDLTVDRPATNNKGRGESVQWPGVTELSTAAQVAA
jgi:hypothetical protein